MRDVPSKIKVKETRTWRPSRKTQHCVQEKKAYTLLIKAIKALKACEFKSHDSLMKKYYDVARKADMALASHNTLFELYVAMTKDVVTCNHPVVTKDEVSDEYPF